MDDHRTVLIRERAYHLFLKRGAAHGEAVNDWLLAEEEIQLQERGHHGPAKMLDQAHHGHLTDPDGCDFENPT
jgi:hypothetical protein